MRAHYHSYSPDEWQQIMNRYASSSLSQKAFCQRESLAMSTFSKWRKQLGLVERKPVTETAADFKPLLPIPCVTETLQVSDQVAGSDNVTTDWDVELTLGAGMTLRIRSAG